MANCADILKEHGIKPSVQRIAILENILARYDHPNADMVFADLSATIPTLSKTTVYSTLKLFAENGLALTVHSDDGVLRYDGHTHFHAHLKCKTCGRLLDIEVGGPHTLPFASIPKGWSGVDEELTYHGICPECSGR